MSDRYISRPVRRYVLERDNEKCVYCGKGEDGKIMSFFKKLFGKRPRTIEFGHVIPNSKGGNECIENIQVECFDCNRAKGNSIRERSFWDKLWGNTLEGCRGRCTHLKS